MRRRTITALAEKAGPPRNAGPLALLEIIGPIPTKRDFIRWRQGEVRRRVLRALAGGPLRLPDLARAVQFDAHGIASDLMGWPAVEMYLHAKTGKRWVRLAS